ncbi:MAG TPA: sensor histidine kinase, partial [Chitinophagaceae bacterium]|nr:sensor histidine kinase [Chitinophagaceae bacterium]
KRKKLQYFIIVAGIGLLFAFVVSFFLPQPFDDARMAMHDNRPAALSFSFPYLIVTMLSLSNRLSKEWDEGERKRQLAEQEKLSAELSVLKAQINPHFLFNALNSIYSLSMTQPQKSGEAVLKLSSMLRYIITDAGQPFITLRQEVAYLKNYINFQRMRLSENVKLLFCDDITDDSLQIAPMLLIPFAENAFKYGATAEKESVIEIHISSLNKTLMFVCRNTIVKKVFVSDDALGIGVSNTKKRLELLYAGKYQLDIFPSDEIYEVILKIDLV